jgi:hypothetical protein
MTRILYCSITSALQTPGALYSELTPRPLRFHLLLWLKGRPAPYNLELQTSNFEQTANLEPTPNLSLAQGPMCPNMLKVSVSTL